MSISGNLLDVSVADVMQFIHLGGRTGTLVIDASDDRAEMGFHRGRIVSAWTTKSRRLGELLLEEGVIEGSTLKQALVTQASDQPSNSLGKILLSMGAITEESLREVVAKQIEQTVYDLVGWSQGTFDFILDELRPVDDIGIYPGDVLPDVNLNTQMVILEALRVFDEKNRSVLETSPEGEGPVEEERADSDTDPAPPDDDTLLTEPDFDLDDLFESDSPSVEEIAPFPPQPPREASEESLRVQIVTRNDEFRSELASALSPTVCELVGIEMRDAGLTLPGESPPIVLVDMTTSDLSAEDISSLRRTRGRASIIAIVNEPERYAELYGAGAIAVIPREVESTVACIENVVRNRSVLARLVPTQAESAAGFARLKRVVADLRSGLLSATVALNLMKVISETVERAVMFLVREDGLKAIGGFGFSNDGKPLVSITNDLEIDPGAGSALVAAMADGQARSMNFDDAHLPESFERLVGRPRTEQVVIFPVLGSEEVIAVVYTDNGQLSREIEEIEILELAAAQVGVAFENEMLRRQIGETGV